VKLVERRAMPPFGHFSLIRFAKGLAQDPFAKNGSAKNEFAKGGFARDAARSASATRH
jgi:hypothetical protein